MLFVCVYKVQCDQQLLRKNQFVEFSMIFSFPLGKILFNFFIVYVTYVSI
jgi:hypothetical protein